MRRAVRVYLGGRGLQASGGSLEEIGTDAQGLVELQPGSDARRGRVRQGRTGQTNWGLF